MTPHCSFLHCYPQKFKSIPIKPDGRFPHCLIHDKWTRMQKVDSGFWTHLPARTQPRGWSWNTAILPWGSEQDTDPHKLKLLRNARGSRAQCFPKMCLHICKECEINGLLSLEGHFPSFFYFFQVYLIYNVYICIYRYGYKYTSFPYML